MRTTWRAPRVGTSNRSTRSLRTPSASRRSPGLRRLALGVRRLLVLLLLVPTLGALQVVRISLGLDAQPLDHRDESVALLGRRRTDPGAHHAVDVDLVAP